mmetsp:Transcript_10206/g.15540  ORF Transcript_10206/g.15540 Transcript_10206/m.15540 type:complete len:160 (+) Transcript_10206:68-547(+)
METYGCCDVVSVFLLLCFFLVCFIREVPEDLREILEHGHGLETLELVVIESRDEKAIACFEVGSELLCLVEMRVEVKVRDEEVDWGNVQLPLVRNSLVIVNGLLQSLQTFNCIISIAGHVDFLSVNMRHQDESERPIHSTHDLFCFLVHRLANEVGALD